MFRLIQPSKNKPQNTDHMKTLSSLDINKVDMQQKIISVIVFVLIVTGISLTVLATVSTKETPKEQGIIMY